LTSWIAANVARPLLVGPDAESQQWVADVAQRTGAPHVVATKVRRGDRDVEVSLPDLGPQRGRTPVVLDDIVSSAHTMIQTVGQLVAAGLPAPVCVGVHGIFARDAERALEQAGAARIVTTRSVPHPTNAIDIADLLVPALMASV
jgi:ribose-phosphate pyrophosphokinase